MQISVASSRSDLVDRRIAPAHDPGRRRRRIRLLPLLLPVLMVGSCFEPADYRIRLNKKIYEIPGEYFPYWAKPKVVDEPESLILRIYLPEFTPRPTRRLPGELRGGHGDAISVWIRKRLVPLNTAYATVAAARLEEAPYHDEFGLRSFRAGGRFRQTLPQPRRIYFAHENQAVTVLIVCEPWHRSPPCVHRFNSDDISFRLTYSMRQLADWKRIQTRIVDRMRSFRRELR